MFDKEFNTIEKLYTMREEFIKTLQHDITKMPVNMEDYLLRNINADIYDSMNELSYWTSNRFKSFLNFNLLLSQVTFNRRKLKTPILVGKKCLKISLDNYDEVLEGVDITYRFFSLNNIDTLNNQLYNAQIYSSNYILYMENLKARIMAKHYNSSYDGNYLENMKRSREKVLMLSKQYTK